MKAVYAPLPRRKAPRPKSEGVRTQDEYPVEVFSDHGLCAGHSMQVFAMQGPHMHSQVELNFVLSGSMTYWFDGRELTLSDGRLALFWGMIPHQVVKCAADTTFVVLYVPMSVFIELPVLSQLRESIFRGGLIEATQVRSFDADLFQRWREDLMTDDLQLEQIVRDELTARVRRIDREGWRDLRAIAPVMTDDAKLGFDHDRAHKVEAMSRIITERALEDISAEDVAGAVGLHPNYAMTLFRRAMGLTIKQSITRHRLDTAQSMLIATDLPVATVAFDCGFGSLSSFYAAFEQRFQKSPAAFRQSFSDRLKQSA